MGRQPIKPETISIHFVRKALQAVQAHALPQREVLADAGIPPHFLDEPLARVSPQQFGALWRGLARRCGDEFFALDARAVRPGSYAMLCRLLSGCENLHHALRRLCRFSGVMLEGLRAELDVGAVHTTLRLLDAQPRRSPFAHATCFMVAYGLSCWLIARRIPIVQCRLAGRAPAFDAEYRVMFCEDLGFGAPQGALVFPSSYLQRRVAQTPASLAGFLAQSPDVFLVKYRNPQSLTARVRLRLRSQAPADWPDLPAAARESGLSQPTFRRRLEAEGTSFQAIKNELRRDMAITRLREGATSVEQLSQDLGFAEAAAFHRAFKKWTGMRPSDYRGAGR